MAAKVCLECTAVYTTDAEKCPQCGAAESRFDWEEPAAARPPATGGVIDSAGAPIVGDGPAPFVVPKGAASAPAGTVTVGVTGGEPSSKAGA